MWVSSAKRILAGIDVAIPEARKLTGFNVIADSGAAGVLTVFKGNAATVGNEIGAMRLAAGASSVFNFPHPVDLEPSTPGNRGIYCVLTGALATAHVYYST